MHKSKKILGNFLKAAWFLLLIWLLVDTLLIPASKSFVSFLKTPNYDIKSDALNKFRSFELDNMNEENQKDAVQLIAREDGWIYNNSNNSDRLDFKETGNSNFPYTMNYSYYIENQKTKNQIFEEDMYLYTSLGDWVVLSKNTSALTGDGLIPIRDSDLVYGYTYYSNDNQGKELKTKRTP